MSLRCFELLAAYVSMYLVLVEMYLELVEMYLAQDDSDLCCCNQLDTEVTTSIDAITDALLMRGQVRRYSGQGLVTMTTCLLGASDVSIGQLLLPRGDERDTW